MGAICDLYSYKKKACRDHSLNALHIFYSSFRQNGLNQREPCQIKSSMVFSSSQFSSAGSCPSGSFFRHCRRYRSIYFAYYVFCLQPLAFDRSSLFKFGLLFSNILSTISIRGTPCFAIDNLLNTSFLTRKWSLPCFRKENYSA